jgi:hypothetical protein
MLMTTTKLIGLRIYNAMFGRLDKGRKLLRIFLEKKMIAKEKYCAASKFFQPDKFTK